MKIKHIVTNSNFRNCLKLGQMFSDDQIRHVIGLLNVNAVCLQFPKESGQQSTKQHLSQGYEQGDEAFVSSWDFSLSEKSAYIYASCLPTANQSGKKQCLSPCS